MFARISLAVLLSVLAAGSSAAGPDESASTLSLEECLRVALKEHPALSGAEANVQASRYRVRQALSGFLPRLDGEYSFVRQSRTISALIQGPSGPTTGTQTQLFNFQSGGFKVSQLLFDFGKTLNRTRSAEALGESTEADRDSIRNLVTLGVKRSYYQLIAFRRLLLVAQETEEQTRLHLKEAEGRYDVGVAPRFDVTQQEVQVAKAELNKLVARHDLEIGRENLHKAMGLREPVDLDPQDRTLDYTRSEIDEETAVNGGLRHRSELRSLRALIRAQEQEIAALKRDYLPIAVGVGNYSFTGSDIPEDEGWSVGAGVRLSIFNGGLTTAEIGEKRALLLRLTAQEEELRQQITLEVRRSFLTVRAAEAGIRVSEKAVEQAGESLAIAEGRYSTGAGNIIELTDAQIDLAGARASHVKALAEYWVAVAELEHAVGAPLEE